MPWGIVRNTNNYCAGLRDKLSSIPAWLFGVFWEPTAAHGGEHVSVFRTALPAFAHVRAVLRRKQCPRRDPADRHLLLPRGLTPTPRLTVQGSPEHGASPPITQVRAGRRFRSQRAPASFFRGGTGEAQQGEGPCPRSHRQGEGAGIRVSPFPDFPVHHTEAENTFGK